MGERGGEIIPVITIKWKGLNEVEGSDFHVLRNNIPSQPLTRILLIERNPESFSSDATALLDKEELEFIGKFNHGQQSLGINLDEKTGVVTANPIGHFLHNFIIRVKLTDKSIDPPKIFETSIRVHIHDNSIKEWLTPSPLTIRQGTSGHRLSLLAEFSDNTIGAISSNSGIEWTSNCKFAEIDEFTGKINVKEIPSGPLADPNETSHIEGTTHIATITAKLSPALMGGTATAKVRLADSWKSLKSEAKPLLSFPAIHATAAETMNDISSSKNILFLSEGFTREQKGIFYELAQRLAYKLNKSQLTKPLNLLSQDWFTYWAVFVESPSQEGGVSMLNDFRTRERFGALWGSGSMNIPFPDSKDEQDGIWTLDRLVFECGMPIPADRTTDFERKKEEWLIAYDINIPDDPDDPILEEKWQDLYKEWQEWSNRRIADEKDTAFGLAYGSFPIISEYTAPRTILFHPYRVTREEDEFHPEKTTRKELDEFLSEIIFSFDDQIVPVGEVWGKDKDGKKGEDYGKVFFLCGGSPDGGTESNIIALGISDKSFVMLEPSAGSNMAVKIKPSAATTTVSSKLYGTVAHELAHELGLDDEYGEQPHVTPKDEENLKDITVNSQLESTLRDDTGRLDPDKIYWKWHRIEKAGFLLEDAEPQANTDPVIIKIRIYQSEDKKRQFKLDDIIRLRGPFLDSRDNRVSKKLKITDIKEIPEEAGSSTRRELTLQLMEDEEFDPFIFYPMWFPKGSILFLPRKGKGPDGPELFLVAPVILEHIRKSNGPLNAPKGDESDRACDPSELRQNEEERDILIATNLPDEDQMPNKRPIYRSYYVGLYESGSGFYCGVYHPSGACLMNSNLPIKVYDRRGRRITRDKKGNRIPSLYNFCPVCKYILVDNIDPILHPIIDDDYGRRYPYDG
jgi:hypothetical protein